MTEKRGKYCDVDGHRICYVEHGRGETLLFVHGITTYSFIWRDLISHFEKDYRVIGVDLLGCGQSDKPLDVPYSIKYHASMMNGFLDQLRIDRVHFIGHDVGGGIGQRFAVAYPQRLYDLTLINTVAYDFWPVQPIIAMRTPIIRQMAMATLDLGAFRYLILRGMYHKDKLTHELMETFWKPMKSKEGRKAFLHFAASLDNRHLLEIEDELHSLALPVLVIRGDADLYLSSSIAEKLASNIPQSKLVRIATAGHFAQIDEPGTIATAVSQFMHGN